VFTTFDQILAFYCAPTLAGIKPASMISYKKAGYRNLSFFIDYYSDKMEYKGIFFEILQQYPDRTLLLVYRKDLLATVLSTPESQHFLAQYGYNDCLSLPNALKQLKIRIQESPQFPHEVGIFLGYPLEDIISFIKNKGQKYRLCGYWKVYTDTDKAKKIFFQYNRCRKLFFNLLDNKISIMQLLDATI
jgi:hypothetical protein